LPEHTELDAKHMVETLLRQRQLHAPVTEPSFTDMEKSVDRIHRAVSCREHVAIFGDYDCDGITATALLVRYFNRRGMNPLVRLPHRERDGYGLSSAIIDEFIQSKVTLLITVDNGISALQEVALATQGGMDVIVTDHHALGEGVPNAYAILHPALAGANEPHPSGAGVAYLLVQALEAGPWQEQAEDCVLAMCGTVADLVGLRGFNRQLVSQGLSALEKVTGEPLALLRESTKARTSTDIAFRIAPRINAAGRMGEPDLALKALLSGGDAIAEIEELNTKRQQLSRDLYEDAVVRVDFRSPLLFAADENYPNGMIGLVAGRLTEASGKPSCVVGIRGTECTASLRSPACYSVVEGLQRCSDLLTRFGGHAQAAGCNFPLSALEELQDRLKADIEERTCDEDLLPTIQVDALLSPHHISLDLCNAIDTLEPFGAGNAEPRFLLQSVLLGDVRRVGTDGAHLQCTVAGTKAVGFGLGMKDIRTGIPFDIICCVQKNHWNGNTQPQLLIEDMRATKTEAIHVPAATKVAV